MLEFIGLIIATGVCAVAYYVRELVIVLEGCIYEEEDE